MAYRKGVSATKYIRESIPHARLLVTFDIKKYYDNVTLKHIEECLTKCGFQVLGARLVGRYCVVRKGNRSTLQQGSPVSPAISNIVGHFHFIFFGKLSQHAAGNARGDNACGNIARNHASRSDNAPLAYGNAAVYGN